MFKDKVLLIIGGAGSFENAIPRGFLDIFNGVINVQK